jgi:uncharacterized Zn finger protein (UPF0148 family)
MGITKDRCHECGTEIEDGEYYCKVCQKKFAVAADLDGTPEIEETEE